MADWLQGELTTMAFCWRLERRDGVVLGLTSHDRALELGGLVYEAAPGMAPSAIERLDGLSPGNVELAGAVSSGALAASDLVAGLWDGAGLKLFAVDWTAPDADPLLLLRGELGGVTLRDGAFEAEFNGAAAALDRPIVPETSPSCRAALGDRACRVDMAGRRRIIAVTAVSQDVVTVEGALLPGAYAFGRLRWIDGANAGLSCEILANGPAALTLADPPVFAVEAGARAEIVEGCDKLFATCRDRFGNGINFRGEPHLPGNDLLTRYAA